MGYLYTALILEQRLWTTIWLVIGLITTYNLLLRWLFIARQRLDLEQTLRKLEEKRIQESEEASTEVSAEGDQITIEEPVIEISQIDEQVRSLLRSIIFFSTLIGLWLIWEQVLPALNVLGETHLWSYRAEVDGISRTLSITLTSLAAAVLVVAVTFVAARNLPGLVEITLLNRLAMDAGARHAFTTICRYAIIAVGIIVAFNKIGVSWSSLKWLVAALGVGLGFGLQEIVANFVCGIIVLFERPFRIGDVVTIGELTGAVSRISIRATTITDWDRHELIVPNKEFITGRLTNWTLSDPIMRLRVPVGIVYGSDTALAQSLLIKVAEANPMVLDQPKPSAFFLGFGDNSLNFELRVFINNVQHWIPVTDQLHVAIDREFRQAGIVIAFPQRDVHLDTIGPLDVRVVSDPANAQTQSESPMKSSDESST
jgi:potassium efflux system protein